MGSMITYWLYWCGKTIGRSLRLANTIQHFNVNGRIQGSLELLQYMQPCSNNAGSFTWCLPLDTK